MLLVVMFKTGQIHLGGWGTSVAAHLQCCLQVSRVGKIYHHPWLCWRGPVAHVLDLHGSRQHTTLNLVGTAHVSAHIV